MGREHYEMELNQPHLAELITTRLHEFESGDLVDILSGLEAQAALSMTSKAGSHHFDLADVFYSSLMISLMLDDDLEEARAVLQRLPPKIAKVSIDIENSVAACKELHRAVWQKKYDTVYQTLRHFNWPVTLIPLVQRYEAYFIQQARQFVERAFTAIPRPLAMRYLGNLEPASKGSAQCTKFAEEAAEHGWRYDESKDTLYPRSLASASPESSIDVAATNESVTRLVTLVGQLATPT